MSIPMMVGSKSTGASILLLRAVASRSCGRRSPRPAAPWIVGSSRGVATRKDDVLKHLKKSGLIPDVLDESAFKPSVQLSARFLSSGEEVSFGNTVTPLDAQGKPSVDVLPFPGEDKIPDGLKGKRGFVVMTDPDAPSRDEPKWSEYAHWISSIKFPTSKDGGEIIHNQASEELLAYTAPAPPPSTGKHRYLLVLLEGEGDGKQGLPDAGDKGGEGRKNWGMDGQRKGLRQWAEKNGLKAVAANYFVSENKPEDKSQDTTKEDLHNKDSGLGVSGPGYGG